MMHDFDSISNETSLPEVSDKGKRLGGQIKRWIAIISAILAIWIVVGALTDWRWWYGLLWSGDVDFEYISEGFSWLLDNYFWVSMLTAVAIIAALLILSTSWGRKAVPQRFAGRIIAGSIGIILVDALLIYHFGRAPYVDESQQAIIIVDALSKINDSLHKMQVTILPPDIEAPIYFHYLDEKRIDALYNQIEAELEEKEREVTRSNSQKGKAGLGFGDANLGLEAEKNKEQKSTFNRPEFSPDRKCLEVMRYIRTAHPESYFSSSVDWYTARAFKRAFKEEPSKARPDQRIDENRLHQIQPLTSPQTDASQKNREDELTTTLQSLKGLVFVDGDFDRTVNGDTLVLTRKFSERPFKCFFRVALPKAASTTLPKTKTLHVQVFGDVTHPLDDGYVDVTGVAVF